MSKLTPLLSLILLCTACNLTPTLPAQYHTNTPAVQSSPTSPQETILATPVLQGKDDTQAQNGAFLMGENNAAGTIDHAATKIALVDRIATAEADNSALAQALAAQNAEAERLKLDTQKSVEQTAKYNSANRKSESEKDAEETDRINAEAHKREAENEAKRLDVRYVEALAELQEGRTKQVLVLFVGALSICAMLIAVSRWRHPRPLVVEEVEAEPEQTRPIFVDGPKWVTPQAPPGDYRIFLAWARLALDGAGLGTDDMVGSGKLYSNHDDYRPLRLWAVGAKIMERPTGKWELSTHGKTYLADAVARADTPSPTQDVPEIAANTTRIP